MSGELGGDKRPESEVSEQINLVDKKLARIKESLAQLEERLKPALRKIAPLPPTPEKPSTIEKELCLLAGSLRTFQRNAEGILNKIHSIKDRIEL